MGFFTLFSILVQEAFYKKRIDTLLIFPALVYNIDKISPCLIIICLGIYRAIKLKTENKNVLQTLCFGYLVSGVYAFHMLINKNIGKFEPFNELHFVLKYKVYARTVAQHAINYNIIARHFINNRKYDFRYC